MQEAIEPHRRDKAVSLRGWVAAVLLAGLAFGVGMLVGGHRTALQGLSPSSITRFDLPGRPIRRVAVGGGAAWFIVQEAGPGGGRLMLVRIDARNRGVRILRSFRSPQYVAAASEGIWVVSGCDAESAGRKCGLVLFELDPSTAQPRRAILIGPGQPTAMGANADGVWVVVDRNPTPVVVRIDPRKNRVVAEIQLPQCCVHDIAVGEGAVWIASENAILQIDPSSDRVVATLHQPVDLMAAGAGRLWVNTARLGSAPVIEMDPVSGGVIQSVEGPGFGYPVVFGGRVWIAVETRDHRIVIHTLSPGAARFEQYPIAPREGPARFGMLTFGPVAILGIGEGAIWTGTDESGQIIRIQLGPADLVPD